MKNRTLVFGITAIALLFVLCACPTDASNDTGTKAQPFPGNPSGTGSGSADGYHGVVTVEITMEDGWITEAKVEGPDETPGIGAVAVAQARAEIKAKNSVDIDIRSGASYTSRAIIKAGKEALEKIIANNSQ